MLHEVLFALSGHCGGVFKSVEGEIKVASDLPFICPSEVDLLNRLCKLGTYYKDFNNFIQKHGETLSLKNCDVVSDDIHGLYLKSFCRGLDRVLENYRVILRKLEMDVLSDEHLPVTHLVSFLQEYHILFPALASVLEQITSHKAHGCYILDILHKNAVCGLPIVRNALNRILYVCHGLLYKQLCSWLLYGCLNDPYQEFFVQLNTEDSEGISSVNMQEEEENDELPIMGVTGRQLQKILSLNTTEISSSLHRFALRAELLPCYIPVRVANKILFVGESVQMFENEKKPNSQKKGSILKNKEEDFSKDLHELSQEEEFNSMAFESLIDSIRTHVAEHLYILVVEDANLASELRIIKDFFLLGRGELFLAFIDQTQTLLRGPPVNTTEHDVNMAFHQAARNVLIDDESLLQRFHLGVQFKGSEKKSDSSSSAQTVESGWNSLSLSYTVQWPLHILLTPSILEKYNRLFRFLMAVKRAQIDLQHCWTLQMQYKQKLSNPEEVAKWQLRTHMAFLVDNLQYYLQVDVIESQFSTFMEKITSTRDFEAVKLAHDQFLSALLSQSFVHMKAVSRCLHEILENCSQFSKLLVHCSSPLSKGELSHLQFIAKNFQRQSNLLFTVLSSVRSHNASPHLAQLLLRLDYNHYFSIAGGQLGSY
ncbi:gamma-tubulin complex component 4-like isoform X1 [Saccostrea echinata]|uniref:gamma-tubulin complex component 4-like isoform X1 n=1 Tax=Saccostrea echinata TaxID=191078 RepID=UPI002A834C08|nr:gamma-tubulin complex component 4-like isoform X1 [Saccostrea echinata]